MRTPWSCTLWHRKRMLIIAFPFEAIKCLMKRMRLCILRLPSVRDLHFHQLDRSCQRVVHSNFMPNQMSSIRRCTLFMQNFFIVLLHFTITFIPQNRFLVGLFFFFLSCHLVFTCSSWQQIQADKWKFPYNERNAYSFHVEAKHFFVHGIGLKSVSERMDERDENRSLHGVEKFALISQIYYWLKVWLHNNSGSCTQSQTKRCNERIKREKQHSYTHTHKKKKKRMNQSAHGDGLKQVSESKMKERNEVKLKANE